jgi:hypothetical protein
MSTPRPDLLRALVEARKAYRILYAYQRRVLDLCSEIADLLQLEFFSSWSYPNGTPRYRKNPTQYDAWSFLPLVDMSVFFSSSGEGSYSSKGDWMLEFRVISDSAYKDAWEASGSKVAPLDTFSSADKTESYMLTYGWLRTKSGTGDWTRDIHSNADWPEPGKILKRDDLGVTAYCQRLEFTDLLDRASVRKHVEKLTADFQRKIGVRLSIRTPSK